MSQIFEFFFSTKFQITTPRSEQKYDKRKNLLKIIKLKRFLCELDFLTFERFCHTNTPLCCV